MLSRAQFASIEFTFVKLILFLLSLDPTGFTDTPQQLVFETEPPKHI